MTSYVVFQKSDTRYAGRKGKYDDPIFPTLAAAKAHMTRLVKKGKFKADEIAVAELSYFRDYIAIGVFDDDSRHLRRNAQGL